jgi:hypothetical protein
MFPEPTRNLVITQTNYDRETAINKLKMWNGDAIKVVKEYLNPEFEKKKKNEPIKSTNQKIMSSIRNFMDDVYKGYEKKNKKKEEEKKEKEEQEKSILKEKKMKRKLELINEINETDGESNETGESIEVSEISFKN